MFFKIHDQFKGDDYMWSANEYLDELYQQTLKKTEGIYDEHWREELKQKFQQILGDFPISDHSFHQRELECVDMGGYVRLRVEITTIHPTLKMPIYILIPKKKDSQK